MTARKHSTTALAPDDRKLVLGAATAQVALLSLTAGLNYMLPDMISSFGATQQQGEVARQASSIAALLVVFVAGVLGQRLGERRVIVAAASLFFVGSVVVAAAPSMTVATVGLLIANVGKAVVSVVVLALLSARIRDKDGRATAFATLSTLTPVAYIVMPVLAGALVTGAGWRSVAVVWALCGLLSMAAGWRLLPRDGAAGETGEMWTPALAGLALASGVQFVGSIRDDGWTATTVVLLGVAVLASLALVVVYRILHSPSLSLQPLRKGGLALLFVVLILFSFANLYYYTMLLYEIVYGFTALGAAILMIPAQLGAMVGASVARKLLQRKGVTAAGTYGILAMGAIMILASTMRAGWPLILPMIFVTAYSIASVCSFVSLTNAIMNLAEAGTEGQTSSYRSAAANIGAAIGVAIMTSLVTLAGTASLRAQSEEAGVPVATTSEAVWALINGTSPDAVSSEYGIPIDQVTQISDMEKVAFVDSYRAQAAGGGVIALVAGGLFYASRRRQERASLRTTSASSA